LCFHIFYQRRTRFQPDLYHQPAPNAAAAAKDPKHATPIQGVNSGIQHVPRRGLLSRIFKHFPKEYRHVDSEEEEGDDTNVLEVWFSGCHSGEFVPCLPGHYRAIESIDVGGGSVPDTTIHTLAHITLRWMVKEVMQSECGICFEEAALDIAVIPRQVPPRPAPVPGDSSEKEAAPVDCDTVDALQSLRVDDQLKLSLKNNPFWWLPEMLFLSYFYQDEDRVWQRGCRSVRSIGHVRN